MIKLKLETKGKNWKNLAWMRCSNLNNLCKDLNRSLLRTVSDRNQFLRHSMPTKFLPRFREQDLVVNKSIWTGLQECNKKNERWIYLLSLQNLNTPTLKSNLQRCVKIKSTSRLKWKMRKIWKIKKQMTIKLLEQLSRRINQLLERVRPTL